MRVQFKFTQPKVLPYYTINGVFLTPWPEERSAYYILDPDPLIARVRLIDGSTVTGKLERLTESNVAFTPQQGSTSKFPLQRVLDISFIR